jgi:type I restriction enzyme R subunit
MPTPEAQARESIDAQLARAGWGTQSAHVREEFRLPGRDLAVGEGSQREEIPDYVLTDAHEKPLAVVEAKHARRDPRDATRQASDYGDELREAFQLPFHPYLFLANGRETYFWHRPLYTPRPVAGFYSQADLERLRFLDTHRQPLDATPINERIVDRAYQHEAIRQITQRLADGHRQFLLVLATGTGKTRVAIALIDVLLRARWAQRILFLADRRELVRQAIDACKEHLPGLAVARIEDGRVDAAARIHVGTYPAMMAAYGQLSPGYYDLVIADESHRSIYSRYRTLLDHFDSLRLGLTATPVDYLDRNTFQLFNCPDGEPTFVYDYQTAVRDGFLVPYRVYSARTHFQIEGLRAGSLPPELAQRLRDQGIDPDDLDFDGTEIEKRIINTGTSDAIVHEFIAQSLKDATGTLPAKSILFAVSHRHALDLLESFNRLYPDLQRRGLARIIDSHMERAEKELDDFKHRDFPRVAISVDMLDTGIDIPAIRNLVFAKPVYSHVKFWQMIGRGTRRHPHALSGEEKTEFLIIDHWDNFAFFQLTPEGRAGSAPEPLPTRLFRLRLEKLQLLHARNLTPAATATHRDLATQLAALPTDNIHVAPHAADLDALLTAPTWLPLDDLRAHLLQHTLAPLLRFATAAPWPVLSFEVATEQLAVAWLKHDSAEIDKLRARIVEALRLLPLDLPEIAAESTALAFACTDGFWQHLDYVRVTDLRTRFAPLMRWRLRDTPQAIRFSLPDPIAQRRWIAFGPAGEGAFVEVYQRRVAEHLRGLLARVPALQRLATGETLDEADLASITAELSRPDLFATPQRLREAYGQPTADLTELLRRILRDTATTASPAAIAALDAWMNAHGTLNATQLRFLRTVRQALLSRPGLTANELAAAPFARIGDPALLFTTDEFAQIAALVSPGAA